MIKSEVPFNHRRYSKFRITNYDEQEKLIKYDLLKEISKFSTQSAIYKIQKIHARIRTKPTIVIMGEIKAGKSSLINALLGDEIVKVKATVATAKNTYIDYGEEPSAYIHYNSNKVRRIHLSEIDTYTVEEASTKGIRDEISYIQVYYPHPLLKCIRLVDSPGLNSQNVHHTKETEKLYKEANYIYWIFNHGMVGRKSEFETLNKLKKLNQNVIGVVNMIDLHYDLSDEPLEDYLDEIRVKLQGDVKEIIGVSASYAIEANKEDDMELWEDSNLHQLIRSILSHRYNHKKLTNTLLKPIIAHIAETEKTFKAISIEKYQLHEKWKRTYISLQTDFEHAQKTLKSIELDKSFVNEKINIQLMDVKDLDTSLYKNLISYIDNYGRTIKDFCTFIQFSSTNKDNRLNEFIEQIKVLWKNSVIKQREDTFNSFVRHSENEMGLKINYLNQIYSKIIDSKFINQLQNFNNFIERNKIHWKKNFNVMLPSVVDNSFTKISTTEIIDDNQFRLPKLSIVNPLTLTPKTDQLMKDLYHLVSDKLEKSLRKLEIGKNVKEYERSIDQWQHVQKIYQEAVENVKGQYLVDLKLFENHSFLEIVQEHKMPLNHELRILKGKINEIISHDYTLDEILNNWQALQRNQETNYWTSINVYRDKMEKQLNDYYSHKWNKEIEKYSNEYRTELTQLHAVISELQSWREKVFHVIGSTQIRQLGQMFITKYVPNHSIKNYFDEFSELDYWETELSDIPVQKLQFDNIKLSEVYYSNKIFFLDFMLKNRNYIYTVVNNFVKEFKKNIQEYEKTIQEYEEAHSKYMEFSNQINDAITFNDLEIPFLKNCNRQREAFKNILKLQSDYKKNKITLDENMVSQVERGEYLLNTYNNLPKYFLSSNTRKKKRKLIKKIKDCNTKILTIHDRKEKIRDATLCEILQYYAEIPKEIDSKFTVYNDNLRNYSKRINDIINHQEKLNQRLMQWNGLIQVVNKQLRENNKPIHFEVIQEIVPIEQMKVLEKEKLINKMSDLTPSIPKEEFIQYEVPQFPKFYIPMNIFVFSLLFALITIVVAVYIF